MPSAEMRLDRLRDLLVHEARHDGVASVSVAAPGQQISTAWMPDAADEPVFLIYSVTKTFIAAVTLMLAEDGRLRLDDALDHWFPAIPDSPRIRVFELLNHTAGIPDYGGLSAYHRDVRTRPGTSWSFDEFAAATFDNGLAFVPGTSWQYSNPGYMLAKRILEMECDRSFRELMSERIATPLELHRTFVAETIADLSTLAPALSTLVTPDGSPVDVRTRYHPGWVSHGVIASTSSDVVRFFDALFGGRLVTPGSLELMLQPARIATNFQEASGHASPLLSGVPEYGLGLMIDASSPLGMLAGHNGGGPGYSVSAFHSVGTQVSVCAVAAVENGCSAEAVVSSVLQGFA